MTPLVAYIRVSTQRQGESGLGLEAQQESIRCYARGTPISAEYREVESGRNCRRPQLARALAHCRRTNATLVVAKLDRLARNVAFLSSLMESKVPFVACDNPSANRLTLHILAAVAEAESEAISTRTREALKAYRARGGVLGPSTWKSRLPGLLPAERMRGSRLGGAVLHARAVEDYAEIVSDVRRMKSNGDTLAAIAVRLNEGGHRTRRDKEWSPKQVSRVLALASVVNYPCLTV